MLATPARAVPEGTEWAYEVKWDGFRGLCFLKDRELRIVSRSGHLLNAQFPELLGLPDSISASTANKRHRRSDAICAGNKARPLLHEAEIGTANAIQGHDLAVDNKVFYPGEGYTKRDVINYYHDVAPLLVPHLAGRPLSLKRYPNGIEGEYFFQKDAPGSFPSWLRTEEIADTKETPAKRMVICNDRATLLYLANLGCIDQNPWFSRVESLDCPDFIVLDLDPYYCAFDRIVEAAQLVRRKLADLELKGYPKTTGGDGMHVYVPIAAVYTYEQARMLAEIIARLVIGERPDLFTAPRTVAQRKKGMVYFDYLQTAWGKTISAPYVLRAYKGAPVATPLRWTEISKGLSPLDFILSNVRSRFDHLGDIFSPVLSNRQRLEPAMARLESLFPRG